jgi:hypothetical protein
VPRRPEGVAALVDHHLTPHDCPRTAATGFSARHGALPLLVAVADGPGPGDGAGQPLCHHLFLARRSGRSEKTLRARRDASTHDGRAGPSHGFALRYDLDLAMAGPCCFASAPRRQP